MSLSDDFDEKTVRKMERGAELALRALFRKLSRGDRQSLYNKQRMLNMKSPEDPWVPLHITRSIPTSGITRGAVGDVRFGSRSKALKEKWWTLLIKNHIPAHRHGKFVFVHRSDLERAKAALGLDKDVKAQQLEVDPEGLDKDDIIEQSLGDPKLADELTVSLADQEIDAVTTERGDLVVTVPPEGAPDHTEKLVKLNTLVALKLDERAKQDNVYECEDRAQALSTAERMQAFKDKGIDCSVGKDGNVHYRIAADAIGTGKKMSRTDLETALATVDAEGLRARRAEAEGLIEASERGHVVSVECVDAKRAEALSEGLRERFGIKCDLDGSKVRTEALPEAQATDVSVMFAALAHQREAVSLDDVSEGVRDHLAQERGLDGDKPSPDREKAAPGQDRGRQEAHRAEATHEAGDKRFETLMARGATVARDKDATHEASVVTSTADTREAAESRSTHEAERDSGARAEALRSDRDHDGLRDTAEDRDADGQPGGWDPDEPGVEAPEPEDRGIASVLEDVKSDNDALNELERSGDHDIEVGRATHTDRV